MTTLVANEAVIQFFRALSGTAEVRDASGNLVGYAASVDDPMRLAYLEARQRFDPEEIRRRKQSREEDLPLSEILQRLESMAESK